MFTIMLTVETQDEMWQAIELLGEEIAATELLAMSGDVITDMHRDLDEMTTERLSQ